MNTPFLSTCVFLVCCTLLAVSVPLPNNVKADDVANVKRNEVERELEEFFRDLDEDTQKQTRTEQKETDEEDIRSPKHITYGTGIAHTPKSSTHTEKEDAQSHLAEWEKLFQLYYGKRNQKKHVQNDENGQTKSDSKNDSKRTYGEFPTELELSRTPQEDHRLLELEKMFQAWEAFQRVGKDNKRSSFLDDNEISSEKLRSDTNDVDSGAKRSRFNDQGNGLFTSGWAHGNVHPSDKNYLEEWEKLYNKMYGKRASIKRSYGNVPSENDESFEEWKNIIEQLDGKKTGSKKSDGIFSSGWAHGNVPSKSKYLDEWNKLFEQMYGKRFQLKRGNGIDFSSGWAHGNVPSKSKHIDQWQKTYGELFGKRSHPSMAENEVDLPGGYKRSNGPFSSGWAHGQKEPKKHVEEWDKMFNKFFGSRLGRSVE